jgi:spermidine/putrescine transport system ATP-binding protein
MNFLPGRVTGRDGGIAIEIAGLGRATVDPSQCAEGALGETCHVGVRPETMSIRFEGESHGTAQATTGTVSEVVYYGDMTYYDVLLDGAEKTVRISMRNLVGRPVLDVGTRTDVTWDPRSLVLFP